MLRPDLAELDAGVDANVREHGWHATGVFGNEPGQMDFVYTAGRVERGLPELICFGPIEGCHALLHMVIRDRESVGPLRPGRLEALWVAQSNEQTYDGYLVEVGPEYWEERLGVALRRAHGRSEGFRCLQLVLGDAENRMPWEDGYEVAKFPQPVLGEVPA